MSRKSKSPRRRRPGSALWDVVTVASPLRSVVVLLCLLMAGLAEGIGIAGLLPLIAMLDNSGGESNGLSRMVLEGLRGIGLPAEPQSLLAVLVFGVVLKAALVLLAMRQVGQAVADVGARMRLDLMKALLDARWSFFSRQPMGRFASALGVESSKAGQAYNSTVQFVANCIQAAVYLAIAAFVSWQLALLAIAIGLVMVLSLNRLVIKARRNAKKQAKRVKTMISRLSEVLIGMKPIKAMGRQVRFGALFQRDARVINMALRREVFSRHANKALQEPILAICLALVIYAALVVWALPLGQLLVMSLLMVQAVSVIGKAQQAFQAARIAETGYRAVRSACEDAQAARESVSGGITPTFDRGIQFREVSFAFGDKKIVTDASFFIPAGGITAIVGRSGIGKTTLGDMILGLHQPASGDVLIDDVPLPQLDLNAWRNMTGYVPQELVLFHDSVLANVTLGDPEFSRSDVEEALRQSGAWEFVTQLPGGMDAVVGERGTLLSGGQRQRIAVARALVHSPKLLILDEATSALDPATEEMIVRNICELSRRTGLTVLSISHQPVWMEKAELVLRLDEGRMLETPRLPEYAS